MPSLFLQLLLELTVKFRFTLLSVVEVDVLLLDKLLQLMDLLVVQVHTHLVSRRDQIWMNLHLHLIAVLVIVIVAFHTMAIVELITLPIVRVVVMPLVLLLELLLMQGGSLF